MLRVTPLHVSESLRGIQLARRFSVQNWVPWVVLMLDGPSTDATEFVPKIVRFSARTQSYLTATDFIAIRLPDCHARIQDTENS